jgi:hypothetical protein
MSAEHVCMVCVPCGAQLAHFAHENEQEPLLKCRRFRLRRDFAVSTMRDLPPAPNFALGDVWDAAGSPRSCSFVVGSLDAAARVQGVHGVHCAHSAHASELTTIRLPRWVNGTRQPRGLAALRAAAPFDYRDGLPPCWTNWQGD